MNTILPAMEILCVEGMDPGEPLKIRRVLKEIRRDARRFGWTDDSIESLPNEWQHRVCFARLQMGCLDWRGWQWRNPRDGHDPFRIPKWKIGLPVYPVKPECEAPEKVGSLLVYCEQALGEMLMFAQALHNVFDYAESVTIEVEPRLAPIYERTFPQARIHALKDLRDASWVKEGEFDAKILMGDVVARFMRSKEAFVPFRMSADPEMVEKWSCYKGMTGFSFHGRQADLDESLFPADWVNLQYGDNKGWGIVPDIDLKADIEDLFGIMANLDRVVTVPNTVSHMAAIIGRPVDVIMTPGKGEVNNGINYRWGMPGDCTMLWHDTIRIHRNPKQWAIYDKQRVSGANTGKACYG